MNWKQIDKNTRIQQNGFYTSWKQQISEDCYNQCVYCSIHENPWGGIDHYHIDHFRPQSRFENLVNTITNLYYACPICNKFKSDDWPNEPDDLNCICYPDPSEHNYSDLFSFNNTNYTISGRYVSSTYLINRLYLNRPQLVYERREHLLKLKAEALINDAKILIELSEDLGLIKQAFQLIANLTQHLHTRAKISPYKLIDLKKEKKKKS
jgi:hypothetical protein